MGDKEGGGQEGEHGAVDRCDRGARASAQGRGRAIQDVDKHIGL